MPAFLHATQLYHALNVQLPMDTRPRVVFGFAGTPAVFDTDDIFYSQGFGFAAATPDYTSIVQRAVARGSDNAAPHTSIGYQTGPEDAPNLWAPIMKAVAMHCADAAGPKGLTMTSTFPRRDGQYGMTLGLGGRFGAYVGHFNARNSTEGAGSRVITGLGFQPQAIIFISNKTYAPDTDYNQWAGPAIGIGAADNSGTQWCMNTMGDYLNNSSTINSIWRNGYAHTILNYYGAVVSNMTLTSMDADGFTVYFDGDDNIGNIGGFSFPVDGRAISYIALGSDEFQSSFDVGITTQGSSGISGLGYEPEGALFFMGADADNVVENNVTGMGIGGIIKNDAGQIQYATTSSRNPGAYPPIARTTASGCILYKNRTGLHAQAAGTIVPGGVNLSWSVNDGVARPMGWVTMRVKEGDDCFTPHIYRMWEY